MKKLKFVYTLIAFVIAASLSITVFAMCAPAPMKAVDADSTISEDYIPSAPTFPDSTEPEEVVVLESVVVERVEPTTYDEASTYLDIALQTGDMPVHFLCIYLLQNDPFFLYQELKNYHSMDNVVFY